ncbi:MAG: hypothetical protein FWD34_09535 [Oscillospiraceae bacterium]|nr:hypothetical protein [Oscillospiraceae bacterium]
MNAEKKTVIIIAVVLSIILLFAIAVFVLNYSLYSVNFGRVSSANSSASNKEMAVLYTVSYLKENGYETNENYNGELEFVVKERKVTALSDVSVVFEPPLPDSAYFCEAIEEYFERSSFFDSYFSIIIENGEVVASKYVQNASERIDFFEWDSENKRWVEPEAKMGGIDRNWTVVGTYPRHEIEGGGDGMLSIVEYFILK